MGQPPVGVGSRDDCSGAFVGTGVGVGAGSSLFGDLAIEWFAVAGLDRPGKHRLQE
jgi:hypothetical protein